MPNFFSAFASDVFRPLATLLIPGAIGVITWFIALLWRFPALRKLVTGNHAETGFVLFLAMVFAGMVFEDFGARWEVLLDRWADERTGGSTRRTGMRTFRLPLMPILLEGDTRERWS